MHHAVIPARNGSKQIINKNLARLTTKSLIEIAISQAISAKFFNSITITTDIPIILDIYSQSKSVNVVRRPAHLATDAAKIIDAVLDLIETYRINEDDFLWLIQPTSPFRNKQDFFDIYDAIKRHDPESAISVKRSIAEHPSKQGTVSIKEGAAYFNPIHDFFSFENKEEMKPMFIRNGCFYVARVGAIKQHKSFVVRPCIAHPMCDWRSVAIDSELDLEIARGLARAYGY